MKYSSQLWILLKFSSVLTITECYSVFPEQKELDYIIVKLDWVSLVFYRIDNRNSLITLGKSEPIYIAISFEPTMQLRKKLKKIRN